jgi:hypothetical protein
MARTAQTVRKGMKSVTKVQKNPGMTRVAGMRLPKAAAPIRPRGAAAARKPRVARAATAGKPGGTAANPIRRRQVRQLVGSTKSSGRAARKSSGAKSVSGVTYKKPA